MNVKQHDRKKKRCEYFFSPQVYITSLQKHEFFLKKRKLMVSGDEANEEKIEREFDSSSQEDNGNTDLGHDLNVFISDGNPL